MYDTITRMPRQKAEALFGHTRVIAVYCIFEFRHSRPAAAAAAHDAMPIKINKLTVSVP
jgi:hypothetical protein